MIDFELVTPEPSTADRPDIGIGGEDMKIVDGKIALTVHSLGAVDAPAGHADLLDGRGKVLASVAIPPIPAPLDLLPKTVTVELPFRTDFNIVHVELNGAVKEITEMNNDLHLHYEIRVIKRAKVSKPRRKK